VVAWFRSLLSASTQVVVANQAGMSAAALTFTTSVEPCPSSCDRVVGAFPSHKTSFVAHTYNNHTSKVAEAPSDQV
jgi:hypothetical protein